MRPIAVDVNEGRVMGKVQQPILTYMRKAAVDCSGVRENNNPSLATPDAAAGVPDPAPPEPETTPEARTQEAPE